MSLLVNKSILSSTPAHVYLAKVRLLHVDVLWVCEQCFLSLHKPDVYLPLRSEVYREFYLQNECFYGLGTCSAWP